MTQITTADGQDYHIVFDYTGNKLTKIEARTGAETATRFRQVEYTYFDSQTHSPDVGSDGDLVQVTLSALKTVAIRIRQRLDRPLRPVPLR